MKQKSKVKRILVKKSVKKEKCFHNQLKMANGDDRLN